MLNKNILEKNKKKLELPENHSHGNTTTKELKKHSSTLVGGAELGRRGERRAARQGLTAQGIPYSQADKPEGTIGERDIPGNPGFQHGTLKTQIPWL